MVGRYSSKGRTPILAEVSVRTRKRGRDCVRIEIGPLKASEVLIQI